MAHQVIHGQITRVKASECPAKNRNIARAIIIRAFDFKQKDLFVAADTLAQAAQVAVCTQRHRFTFY